jgi:hypothetical protein
MQQFLKLSMTSQDCYSAHPEGFEGRKLAAV